MSEHIAAYLSYSINTVMDTCDRVQANTSVTVHRCDKDQNQLSSAAHTRMDACMRQSVCSDSVTFHKHDQNQGQLTHTYLWGS